MGGLHALGMLLLAGQVTAPPPPSPPSPPDLRAIASMVEKGQLDAAERQLRQFLAQIGDPAVTDMLGVVLSKKGRLAEAEQEFQKAISANPAQSGPRQHLARLYLAQSREPEALEQLRRAVPLGPLERNLALALARAEVQAHHPALAELQLQSVVDRFRSAEALLELARLQSSQKQVTAAGDSLRRALSIAPNSEEILSSQAQLSLTIHAPVPALVSLEPLTRMYPSVAQYRYLFGVALMQVGDLQAAGESLSEADRLEPNRPLTLIALGLTLNSRKLYAEAKPYLLRCLEQEPENLDAMAALAESEEGMGDLATAETHARRVLDRLGTNPTANLVLGMVLMKQDQYAPARAALLKAIAADPASAKAHYQLSLAFTRLNDPASAQTHLELYRQKLKEVEESVQEARAKTGLAPAGMHP
jgi:cellulose synthase operon protein C